MKRWINLSDGYSYITVEQYIMCEGKGLQRYSPRKNSTTRLNKVILKMNSYE